MKVSPEERLCEERKNNEFHVNLAFACANHDDQDGSHLQQAKLNTLLWTDDEEENEDDEDNGYKLQGGRRGGKKGGEAVMRCLLGCLYIGAALYEVHPILGIGWMIMLAVGVTLIIIFNTVLHDDDEVQTTTTNSMHDAFLSSLTGNNDQNDLLMSPENFEYADAHRYWSTQSTTLTATAAISPCTGYENAFYFSTCFVAFLIASAAAYFWHREITSIRAEIEDRYEDRMDDRKAAGDKMERAVNKINNMLPLLRSPKHSNNNDNNNNNNDNHNDSKALHAISIHEQPITGIAGVALRALNNDENTPANNNDNNDTTNDNDATGESKQETNDKTEEKKQSAIDLDAHSGNNNNNSNDELDQEDDRYDNVVSQADLINGCPYEPGSPRYYRFHRRVNCGKVLKYTVCMPMLLLSIISAGFWSSCQGGAVRTLTQEYTIIMSVFFVVMIVLTVVSKCSELVLIAYYKDIMRTPEHEANEADAEYFLHNYDGDHNQKCGGVTSLVEPRIVLCDGDDWDLCCCYCRVSSASFVAIMWPLLYCVMVTIAYFIREDYQNQYNL